jgi:prophage regulatory protein
MRLLDHEGLKAKGITHSESQIYRLAKAGKFPRPIKVSRRPMWPEAEIDAWITDRVAERDAAHT